MTYLDNHTHLDDIGLDDGPRPVEELVRLAALAGVDTLIHSGTDVASSHWAVEQAERFPGVWATVGYHPHEAADADEDGLAVLASLSAHLKVLALGETGLDYYRNRAPRAAQQAVFVRHLELAAAAGLPVVIHTREAAADTLRLLDAHGAGVTVVLHCFSLPERLPELVERGYYLSFAGNVTYKNAHALQAAVREAPADRLLLETDAPFLTPVPYRGRPNSSALVVHTYEFVAAQRGTTAVELARQVRENATRAYPRLRLE
jgi:TatD DNase family protein